MKDFSYMQTYNLEHLFQRRPKKNPINLSTGISFDRASASILFYQEVQRDSLALQKPFFFFFFFFFLESYQFWALESGEICTDPTWPQIQSHSSLELSQETFGRHTISFVSVWFSLYSENRLAESVDNPSSSLFLEKQKGLPVSGKNSGWFLGERPTNAVSCGLITSRRWALFMDRLVVCAYPKQPEKGNPH